MKKRKQQPKRQYTGNQIVIANNGQTVTASEHGSVTEMIPNER